MGFHRFLVIVSHKKKKQGKHKKIKKDKFRRTKSQVQARFQAIFPCFNGQTRQKIPCNIHFVRRKLPTSSLAANPLLVLCEWADFDTQNTAKTQEKQNARKSVPKTPQKIESARLQRFFAIFSAFRLDFDPSFFAFLFCILRQRTAQGKTS